MESPDPYDSDSGGSELSDSFGERQLTAAEAETELVPAMEGLCITGEARPGCLLKVEGCPVGGTVRCDFAWVRCFDGGFSSYIEGENKSTYLVTADDVDSFLAIEAIPIGEDKTMGEMIRKYANERRKILCDFEMYGQIEQAYFVGHASFNVSMLVGSYSGWKMAKLELQRNGFCITGSSSIVISDKFSPSITVKIPCGTSTGFLIQLENESIQLSAEASLLRDIIVLTMRLFITRAAEKDSPPAAKKRRKRFLFF
ncbi:hypothetical protein Cni_G00244 [Canna indica]|uniref:Uncharacterized protein n=1 Tax=Canna indica TaxID=4628 RepID=A0AAQ3PWW1_9LILI|nr:hypothetical protein Cni_G00244 [Canna indica]